jgi:DNA polymerase (family 10)
MAARKQSTGRARSQPGKAGRARPAAGSGTAAGKAQRAPRSRTAVGKPEPAAPTTSAPATSPPVEPVPSTRLAPELAAELRHEAGQGGGPASGFSSANAISTALLEIAALLELTGANVFKVRAYENAARALAGLGEDPGLLQDSERLQEVRGIGSGIAEKVAALARTGRLDYWEELKSQVPPGLLDMLRISGLGPKRAKALHEALGIASVAELEAACREGSLATLKGFGAKTEENLLAGIERLRRVSSRFLWSFAQAQVLPILEELRHHPAVQRCEVAGSLRRRKETVGDVDLLVSTRDAGAIMSWFVSGPWTARVLGSGETKTSLVHVAGPQIDLRAVTDAEYPYALHHFTGSKEHNIAMRGRAQHLGLKMNEYGLFRGDELLRCRDEVEIFSALGLAYIPPELREDLGEIEAAETGGLPAHLLEPSDLQGAFHVHTNWSDGRASLEDLVRGAKALGWRYIGISDHSQAAEYAHGLAPERILEQRAEIEALRARLRGIRILHGIEAEILPDGSLDYEAEVLSGLDFVIAAVHGGFGLSRDDQTRRLVRAVENPYSTILGHPTGRIRFEREACEMDLPAVLEAAARHGVAVEIDSHPQRMDLDGASAKLARDKGALLCIGPDAHDVQGLEDVQYGVGTARRGWLEPSHVLNAWPLEEVEKRLNKRKAVSRR